MKKTFIFFLMVLVCINLSANEVFAKHYAWLIDNVESKAYKLDVDDSKIIQHIELKGNPRISVSLQDDTNNVVAGTVNNLLFFVNDYGRVGQWIGIYNLKDLSFRKKLEIDSRDPSLELPEIVIPSIGNKFYVIWWDTSKEVDGKGGETYSVYDKASLKKITELPSFPIDLYKPWRISVDGKRVYSINLDINEIKVYDSNAFELLEAISIADVWEGNPLFRKGMDYFSKDKALFADDLRVNENDPSDFKYFTYNILSKNLSNKINIGEIGDGLLSPDGNKIIIIESHKINPNKIHIYDSVTGQKLKYLDLSTQYKFISDLNIETISPDSSKLYLAAESIESGASTMIVIDLKDTFSVVAEIPVEGLWMIFFEE
jgi:hypothetical protein